MEHEFNVLTSSHHGMAGYPTCSLLERFVNDPGAFFLMERICNIILAGPEPGSRAPTMRCLSKDLVEKLAASHSGNVSQPGRYVQWPVKRWIKRYGNACTDDLIENESGIRPAGRPGGT
jgi:hypothetical protein